MYLKIPQNIFNKLLQLSEAQTKQRFYFEKNSDNQTATVTMYHTKNEIKAADFFSYMDYKERTLLSKAFSTKFLSDLYRIKGTVWEKWTDEDGTQLIAMQCKFTIGFRKQEWWEDAEVAPNQIALFN